MKNVTLICVLTFYVVACGNISLDTGGTPQEDTKLEDFITPPVNLKTVLIDNGQVIHVSWDKVKEAVSYELLWASKETPDNWNVITNVQAEYYDLILSSSYDTYSYKVKVIAINKNGFKSYESSVVTISFGEESVDVDSLILEEFDGNIVNGNPHGITYENSPTGQAAVFTRTSESRIQYPYSSGFPKEGTIEFLIKVDNAYNYNKYTLNDDQDCALIFTTDIQGGDVTWSGSGWVYVCKNGDITFHIAGERYEAGWNAKYKLKAENTEFKFGEWNKIGISFGDKGRYIMLNGSQVASNINQTERLGSGGTHSSPVDHPTLGESVSVFWSNNQYEGGFEGAVDKFRVSEKQKDWYLSK
jgi:hypothetical protein